VHAADAMRTLYKTPIVFCTGYGDPDTIWRIRRFGHTQCLFKPVRPQELRDALLKACELSI
jgi:CheY-like chemotaxis protein